MVCCKCNSRCESGRFCTTCLPKKLGNCANISTAASPPYPVHPQLELLEVVDPKLKPHLRPHLGIKPTPNQLIHWKPPGGTQVAKPPHLGTPSHFIHRKPPGGTQVTKPHLRPHLGISNEFQPPLTAETGPTHLAPLLPAHTQSSPPNFVWGNLDGQQFTMLPYTPKLSTGDAPFAKRAKTL